MMAKQIHTALWVREIIDETQLAPLAKEVLGLLQPGTCVSLMGELGTGKTAFARQLIRLILKDPEYEVPSPTFTLVQTYFASPPNPLALSALSIVHADFFRIDQPEELEGLGWEEIRESSGLVLVEWGERFEEMLASDRLILHFSTDIKKGESYRKVTLTGQGYFASKIDQARARSQLLQECGWQEAQCRFMQGDASARSYERLILSSELSQKKAPQESRSAVLMLCPPRPDGPPLRYGKPYSAIARLAENIIPFLALAQALGSLGFSVPKVYGHKCKEGLALLEDFGQEGIVQGGAPVFARYQAAIDVLVNLHQCKLPETIPGPDGSLYRLPLYDLDALMIEIELLLDWYIPHIAKIALSSAERALFLWLWRSLLGEMATVKLTWVLRDYHSPNLLWLPSRKGILRIGLLDFQDCVWGHPAYDVVSLLQDARVTIPDSMEQELLNYYLEKRFPSKMESDRGAFLRAYACLGAQRATKILGIFARLDRRDHKPHYLAHLPRVETYLHRCLAHSALTEIKDWYAAHLKSPK